MSSSIITQAHLILPASVVLQPTSPVMKRTMRKTMMKILASTVMGMMVMRVTAVMMLTSQRAGRSRNMEVTPSPMEASQGEPAPPSRTNSWWRWRTNSRPPGI
uniref:Uncharacterized protein n=1 Tax=Cacopsylla melanoneura TaxID=428564 RepID=A0A8D8T740_9HEMI